MPLTSAQLTTLATDIAANTNTAPGTSGQIKDLAHTPDNAFAVATWYSQVASPAYYVWRNDVPVPDILDKLTFTNYTPNDSPDNTNTYNNRCFTVQIKQQNLALLFLGRETFDATKVNLRAGLNDATTNLLTGAAGAVRSGGWANILPILSTPATNVEKLFAADDGAGIGNTTTDPRGANTNPDARGYFGGLTDADVRQAWGI